MNDNYDDNQAKSDKITKSTPVALQRKIQKHYLCALFVSLLTILCIIMLKNWGYLVGLLFSAYLVWLGMDIELRWKRGDIVCKRVLCIKVKKLPLTKNKLLIVVRDLETAVGDEAGVMNFYLPDSGKEAAQFSERVILNIYVGSKSQTELLAWQAIDIVEDT